MTLKNKLLQTLKQWIYPSAPRKRRDDPDYIIDKLFARIDGVVISHAERDRLQINDTTFTYGEVTVAGFASMLEVVRPEPHEILYDLGSGTGRAIFCAALCYDWKKCVGIEFLPGLCQVSMALYQNLLGMEEYQEFYGDKQFPVEFICDDFIRVDFSEADIVFVNATTMNPVLWGTLQERFKQLKAGARIIVSTRKLDEAVFDLMHQSLYPMSWGDCTVFIYRKKNLPDA